MYIGTAGWSIPRDYLSLFPEEGSHLQRYAKIFNCVEINSSFYKEHMAKTYLRWARDVPAEFRFSVKLSQRFTHDCGFKPLQKEVQTSLENVLQLEEKLGMILIQIPGKLSFKVKDAERFYKIIRKTYQGPLAIEPRNCEWVSLESQKLLFDYKISKVIADPERCGGGSKKLLNASGATYFRLHGSPVIYRSSYSKKYLDELAKEMKPLKKAWCIFDNTTFGKATENAHTLKENLIY